MKPRSTAGSRSGRIVQWPLLSILVGCALGIILRNWTLGSAIGLLGGVGFLHVNFQFEGRKDKFFLAAMYTIVLSAGVLAARGRPELVWIILFAAALTDTLRRGRR
jgi:hypothetical protein